MDSANFINYIKNPGQLHQVTFQELNSLIEAYPYCQNLHFLVLMKTKIEQHKDFEKRLSLAATYCPDRKFLFKQIQAPAKPQSTSDSFQKREETPAGTELSGIIPPPPTAIEESDSGLPPADDEPSLASTDINEFSDSTTDDMKIIEDELGSQLIFKKEGLDEASEAEKRTVIFIEDLFDDHSDGSQPSTPEDLSDDKEPVEMEEDDTDENTEDTTPGEHAPVTDNSNSATFENELTALQDEGPATDYSHTEDLHDLPGEPDQPIETDNEEESVEEDDDEFIEIPDHIIDKIPFEITNIPDSETTPQENIDISEATDENPEESFEQFGESHVSQHDFQMEQDDNEDDNDEDLEPEEGSTPEEDEVSHEDSQEPGFVPLPKVTFKSWSGQFKPYHQEKKAAIVTEDQPVESTPGIDSEPVDEVNQSEQEAEQSESKVELSKKELKKQKKKERKAAAKLKKAKAKKKKKKKIKQLAKKSLALHDDIISETLATLLVEQGSNKKAIKMYRKLSLIFPEKSAFFAAQIKKLKK